MGRKTSDFVAIAAVIAGSGLGLGLTSLFARSSPGPDADDSSVRVLVDRHVVTMDRDRIIVRDGSMAPTMYVRRALSQRRRVNVEGLRRVERQLRRVEGLDGEKLERLRSRVEELQLETREMSDFEELFEALEGLEDLDLSQNFTIGFEMRHDDDDRRRRRRGRRPPRRAAEVPDSDGN